MTEDRLTYAIGDIHGRLDLLRMAFDAIHADAGDDRGADVVCLGDYVDRGPDSRGVVALLMDGPQRPGDTLTCLKGNHEAMMLDGPSSHLWLMNGGEATLASYGGRVDPDHMAWAAALPTALAARGRLFVHAGFMPNTPIEEQDEEAALWVRERFLRAPGAFDGWPHIVHGHTHTHAGKPDAERPELLDWRTNLDTAAFHTGVLTVGVFEGDGGRCTRALQVCD